MTKLFGQRVGFFVWPFFFFPQKGSFIAPALLSPPPTKGTVKDLGLIKLNEDKVIHFTLGILYTNTAKSEYLHEPLPLKLTQLFQQTKVLVGGIFRGEPHTRTLCLANLTWHSILSEARDSFLQKTENLEEFKYRLPFMKLLLTQVNKNRSPKDSLKWIGRQVHQQSQYCWYQIPRL